MNKQGGKMKQAHNKLKFLKFTIYTCSLTLVDPVLTGSYIHHQLHPCIIPGIGVHIYVCVCEFYYLHLLHALRWLLSHKQQPGQQSTLR